VNHNWDDGFAKLNAILKSPLCDRATACAIYWMGQPGYFLQYSKANEVPEVHRKNYRFIKKLEQQIMDGVFSENQLPFDPGSLAGFNRLEEATAYETDKNMIPEELKKVLPGSVCPHFDMERKIEGRIIRIPILKTLKPGAPVSMDKGMHIKMVGGTSQI